MYSDRIFAANDLPLPGTIDLKPLRYAIRRSRKVKIQYRDGKDAASTRVVWPIALAHFNRVWLVVAWCEMRSDFRHFRADRIELAECLAERYPANRRTLLDQWRKKEGHDLEH